MNTSLSMDEIEFAIAQQLNAEKQMGANEAQMKYLEAVLSDLLFTMKGGNIVGGVRI